MRELTEKHTNIECRQTQANESVKTLYGDGKRGIQVLLAASRVWIQTTNGHRNSVQMAPQAGRFVHPNPVDGNPLVFHRG